MIVLSIFFFLTSFSYFRKLHLKNHELSMLSYQHVLPFIVCNVSAKKKKKKSGSRHNSVYTTKREQSVSQYIYTRRSFNQMQDARTREREREIALRTRRCNETYRICKVNTRLPQAPALESGMQASLWMRVEV